MDNVAIVTNSIIMQNIKINSHVIIGTRSIVTKDIPKGVVVIGVPAKTNGSFDDFVKKEKITLV